MLPPGVKGSRKLDEQLEEQAGLVLLRYAVSPQAFQLCFCRGPHIDIYKGGLVSLSQADGCSKKACLSLPLC